MSPTHTLFHKLIPDDTGTVVAHRLNHISKLILGFCDIQRRETQRDRHEQRRVSELLARADTPTEAEGEIVSIHLWVRSEEAFGLERERLVESIGIMSKLPGKRKAV